MTATTRKVIVGAVALVALGSLLALALGHFADLRSAWGVARSLHPLGVGLALCAEALSYLGAALVIRSAARLVGVPLATRRAAMLAFAGTAVGALGGGAIGGAAAMFRWLRRDGADAASAGLIGAAQPLVNALTIGSASVLGIGVLLPLHRVAPASLVALLAALGVIVSLLAVVLWGSARPERLGAVTARLASPLDRFRDGLGERLGDGVRTVAERAALLRRGWRAPLAADVLNVSADASVLALLFWASGHPVAPETFLAGYALPLLLTKASVVPGGLGIVEGGMAGLYALLGVPLPVAVAVVLVYRGIAFWLPVGVGLVAAAVLERSSGET